MVTLCCSYLMDLRVNNVDYAYWNASGGTYIWCNSRKILSKRMATDHVDLDTL